MAKVVSIGYAIDNGEDIESTKYQIEINRKVGNIGNKTPATQTEQTFNHVASSGNKNNTPNAESEIQQHVDYVANGGQQNRQQETAANVADLLPAVGNKSATTAQ